MRAPQSRSGCYAQVFEPAYAFELSLTLSVLRFVFMEEALEYASEYESISLLKNSEKHLRAIKI